MNVGTDPGPWLAEADVVLVIDSLAPWMPDVHEPAGDCQVVQLGPNPLYSRFPVRNFRSNVSIASETGPGLVGPGRGDARGRRSGSWRGRPATGDRRPQRVPAGRDRSRVGRCRRGDDEGLGRRRHRRGDPWPAGDRDLRARRHLRPPRTDRARHVAPGTALGRARLGPAVRARHQARRPRAARRGHHGRRLVHVLQPGRRPPRGRGALDRRAHGDPQQRRLRRRATVGDRALPHRIRRQGRRRPTHIALAEPRIPAGRRVVPGVGRNRDTTPRSSPARCGGRSSRSTPGGKPCSTSTSCSPEPTPRSAMSKTVLITGAGSGFGRMAAVASSPTAATP